jgi:hypothetical protein
VCERLSARTGLEWNNADDNAPIQSRQMGQSGVDIILRGEALEYIPFSFECKATEVFHIEQDIAQAKANRKPKTDWVLVHKKSSESPTVTIEWNTFERLINFYFWNA